MFDERPATAAAIRERFHAFTVDEYQDVNPLQQALLERWLGGRDQICVVGDDHQTIYTFTGASPEHLLSFPRRYPGATVVRLEENYRSTPQVLTVANALAGHLGGFRRSCAPRTATGHIRPGVRRAAAEVDFVAEMATCTPRARRSRRSRCSTGSTPGPSPTRRHSRRPGSPTRSGTVRSCGGGPRSVLARLRRAEPGLPVRRRPSGGTTDAVGYDPLAEPDIAEEVTRQADSAGSARSPPSTRWLARMAMPAASSRARRSVRGRALRPGRGASSYHRAKGLEFEAVFLPRLLDKELPFRSGRAAADPVGRRLLYVGITRARRHLYLFGRPIPDAAEPVPVGGERPPADEARRIGRTRPSAD